MRADHCLYVYGGWDGQLTYNNLHQLDVLTMTWTELKPAETSEIPMKMSGCGLVNCGKDKLVLFGGCGVPIEDSQQSSSVPKSTSGTVSYTTVRSNEGSGVGASQEEEVRLLEVTDVSVQAEVHSQPDSLPPGTLSEGVMDLYNLAVSQVDSQVSHHSLSQAASSQDEAATTTTQPPGETRNESQNNSQVESKSEEVGEESINAQPQSGEKEEAPAQAKNDDQASASLAQENKAQSQPQENEDNQQSPKKERDETQSQSQENGNERTQEKGDEIQSQSQEKGELKSEEVTAQSVPHENGEVKVQPAQPLENGVPETESKDEKEAESPSHSQDGGASKPSSPEKVPAPATIPPSHSQDDGSGASKPSSPEKVSAAATIPQSHQNGEIEEQPPAVKEEESKKPSDTEIQPQPQPQSESQSQFQSQSQPAEEESEEESDDGSDVMDRRWTNELKIFDLKES